MNGLHNVPISPITPPSARYNAQQLESSLRAKLVDEIECGVIVCDGRGKVRFANCSADQELATARLLTRRDDELRCMGPNRDGFFAALRTTATTGRRHSLMLTQASERLMVSLIPFFFGSPPEPLVLIVLGRRGFCSALGLEMLANVYALTLTERRVLAGLMNETAPREIANRLGVAISTVRSHIASIRSKLGVRNIEGILFRVAEMPPVPSALRSGGVSSSRSVPLGADHDNVALAA